ncbi:hypothetical protein RP20_CCG024315 [Aedes albopictus]|nr:hypothetical protein RP20_CCG024315 [Aedes albopictus]
MLAGIESGCNTFIVHHHVILDFLDIFLEAHDLASYRNPNKYVVLLLEDHASNDLLDSIRNHPCLWEIMNFLVCQPARGGSVIELLSHRFIDYGKGFAWHLVDRYHTEEHAFDFGNVLFPDRTLNLLGRSIRVATFNVNPHIFLSMDDAGNSRVKLENHSYLLDGLNGFLLVEFCRRRNCTIDLVVDSKNMWGVIQPNRTGNGIIGNLVERRADLGIGALSNWHHCYSFLTFSAPVQRGGVTCLTPKPNLLPRWKVIAMVFLTSVYLSIIGTFVCSVAIYTTIFRYSMKNPLTKSIVWNALNVLAVFLLQSTSNFRNRSVSETIFSVALLLFSLNIAAIYSGKYASLRTIPLYESAINTLEDLAKSGIPWLQAHEAWSYSLLLSKNPTIMKLVSLFKVYPIPKLHQIADQGGSAFAMGRLSNGHLMLGDWINAGNIHRYQLMRDDLYYEHEIAMATKTWPLIEKFNELLHQTASGLLLRPQELRIMYQHNDYYVQTVGLNSHVRAAYEPRALALEDVFGGLIVLGFGLLCAGVAFVTEVWVGKSPTVDPNDENSEKYLYE